MSKIVKLREICVDLSDGLHKAPIFNPDGEYIFVNANNLDNGYIIYPNDGKRADKSEYDKYKIELDENTVLYSIDGTIGKIAKYRNEKVILGKGACYLRVKPEINADYIYYLLQSPHFCGYINTMSTGSTIHHISLATMRNYEFPLPKREKQDAIAYLLSNIDSKINNNKKIQQKLEKMAKTLYDYWFVQFDFPDANGRPYKTSGGKMEWNETLSREIPAGWEVDNLFRIASYVNGLACQKYRPQGNEESLPVIKIREMHEGVRPDTERVSANIPLENVIGDGDILFSWSATLEIQYWTGGKGGLNQHIFKVIPSEDFPKEYIYHQLKDYIVNFVKIAEARKTTMGHITQDHLKFSRIVIPPYEVLRRFEERMKPIHKQMVKCNQENRKLIYLRDFLLPMLMNGQVTFRQ